MYMHVYKHTQRADTPLADFADERWRDELEVLEGNLANLLDRLGADLPLLVWLCG